MKKFCLAVHGGAGALLPSDFTPEEEERYKIELKQALDHGYNILKENGSALDAVEACVKYLEDCPLFNAGRGSVYNFDGKHEMDASIMCGATLKAGAVALVRRVKNPVALARSVMERSDYVFLCGEGAEQFAEFYKIEMADETYFDTPLRLAQWMKLKGSDIAQLDHTSISKSDIHTDNQKENSKFGTVGAVALDLQGNLAAATSTGGMTNKRFGRIGDSPIIGAGTYANNQTCAVSCTGHGEYFIRSVAVYEVSVMMSYKNLSLNQACTEVINKVTNLNGKGGLIAVDKNGNVAMHFNCGGMFRGMKDSDGKSEVLIF